MNINFVKKLSITNIPIGTQILMISHLGKYSIGKVMLDKHNNSKYVSNDYYAKYYAILDDTKNIINADN